MVIDMKDIKKYEKLDQIPKGNASHSIQKGCLVIEGGAFRGLYNQGVLDAFMENDIKVVFSGRDEPLPKRVINARDKLAAATCNNTGGILNICLNYGGRAEIVDCVKKMIDDNICSSDISEDLFSRYLYNGIPDVDLMIRTSGECRLSNFLLWQNSYAEFYFAEKNFPEFKEDDFDMAILAYNKRDRRFGGINKSKAS